MQTIIREYHVRRYVTRIEGGVERRVVSTHGTACEAYDATTAQHGYTDVRATTATINRKR